MIELGTSPFGNDVVYSGLNFASSDGTTLLSIGADGGYFIGDNSAIKIGFGFLNYEDDSFISYMAGFKHYLNGKIPIQVDLIGSSGYDSEPLYAGLQGGYALFLGEKVSFEPTLRYNASLNADYWADVVELRFNFTLFL